MAAPKKLTVRKLLEVFDGNYRYQENKIELTASEVTEIINGNLLGDGTTVSRQAVHYRLQNLVGTKLVQVKHGRTHTYYRVGELDDVCSEESHDDEHAE